MHKLHKVNVIEQFSGREDVIFVDPNGVNNVSEVTIGVPNPDLNTRDTHQVKATQFASGRTYYHTLWTVKELVSALGITLIEVPHA
jgi:hypothetical protein